MVAGQWESPSEARYKAIISGLAGIAGTPTAVIGAMISHKT